MNIERKPDGYWKDVDTTMQAARAVLKRHGLKKLPNSKQLVALGHASLVYAIEQHHGGMRTFRERSGEVASRKEHGVWKNLDFCVSEARKIIDNHDLETFPTANEMKELGYNPLLAAINRYHGGVHEFAQHVGLKTTNRRRKIWEDESYALEEALRFMQQKGYETLPSGKILHAERHSSLWSAINRYHGGMQAFREKLNQRLGRASQTTRLTSLLEHYAVGGKDE